jgi:hypothetical protein
MAAAARVRGAWWLNAREDGRKDREEVTAALDNKVWLWRLLRTTTEVMGKKACTKLLVARRRPSKAALWVVPWSCVIFPALACFACLLACVRRGAEEGRVCLCRMRGGKGKRMS